jgi:hypothetical protein
MKLVRLTTRPQIVTNVQQQHHEMVNLTSLTVEEEVGLACAALAAANTAKPVPTHSYLCFSSRTAMACTGGGKLSSGLCPKKRVCSLG